MPHPFHVEPDWVCVPGSTPLQFTRPLLGLEADHNGAQEIFDGLGEVCMGITFKSTLSVAELEAKTRECVALLRWYAPIVACTITGSAADFSDRAWLYTACPSDEAAMFWVNESLSVRHAPFDAEDFIAEMNLRRAIYTHSDGHKQHMHFYLLIDDNEVCCLFIHGTHALMDARPTLRALDLMLKHIACRNEETIVWGSEWTRLPKGPISATGGIRSDWDVDGERLLQDVADCLNNPIPTISLHAERNEVAQVGNMTRVQRIIDEMTSKRIVEVVKMHRLTMSQIADACLILSIFDSKQKVTENEHITLDVSVFSRDRYLVPPHDQVSHFISGLVVVPLKIRRDEIPLTSSARSRLLAVAYKIKEQYDKYLSNPNFPHLLPSMSRGRVGGVLNNPCASLITNLGSVGNIVRATYLDSLDSPVIMVEDMCFGHRLSWQRLMNHIWTMNSRIYLQVQASDVWDRKQIETHLEDFEAQLLNILSEDDIGAAEGIYVNDEGALDCARRDGGAELVAKRSPTILELADVHHEPYPFIDPSKSNLKGKVVFITGASRGLGRAAAIATTKAGASGIVLAARSSEKLDEVARVLEDTARANGKDVRILQVHMDVLDHDSVQAAASKALATFSNIDVLFNAAGIMDKYTPFSTSDSDNWAATFDVNVRGTYMVTRALLPLMNLSEIRGQTIINLVSNIPFISTPITSAYKMSKLALICMSEVMQSDENLANLTTIAVHPGCVPTAMTSVLPDEVRAAFLIDSEKLSAHTMVWLAAKPKQWLNGRYVSCNWDMKELEEKREEIVAGNKLRLGILS